MKTLLRACLVGLLALGTVARAEVLVMVHGYLGNAGSWEFAGVGNVLETNGWKRAGISAPVPGGLAASAAGATAEKKFYLVELPFAAPVLVQADHLLRQIQAITARHPQEKLILVGHSAGGVVARAMLVRSDAPKVAALVTIASPHAGTALAGEALDVADVPFPFSIVPAFFGGDDWRLLRGSRALYADLLPPFPGSMLAWLNTQPHPDIRYVSIVRGVPYAPWGDPVVPGFSQDMNSVPALAGRSRVVTVPTGHFLEPRDGMALVDVLTEL